MSKIQSGNTVKLFELRLTTSHDNFPKLTGSSDSSLHSTLRCFNWWSLYISWGRSTRPLFATSNRVKRPKFPMLGGKCVMLLRSRFKCRSVWRLCIPVISLTWLDASNKCVRSMQHLNRLFSNIDRPMPSKTSY